MGDAQTWVLIGGFLAPLSATIMSAMVGLVLGTVGSKIHTVGSRIDVVAAEFRLELGRVAGTLRAEIGALGSDVRRVEGVLTQRLDSLDRDVQALTERFSRDGAP